jgi:hypothetical protein
LNGQPEIQILNRLYPKDFASEIVRFNKDFIKEKILEADLNYKTVFIPEYFEQRWPRGLKPAAFEMFSDL